MLRNRKFIIGALCTASFIFITGESLAQFAAPKNGGRLKTESGFFTDQIITIPVRAAGHEDYSRMVFDWPYEVGYEIEQVRDGVLDIKFQRRALVDTTEVRDAPETNFGKIDVISGLGQHLKVRVVIPEKANYKTYRLGYKVVIDVSDVPGQKRGEGLPRNIEPPKQIATDAEEESFEPSGTEGVSEDVVVNELFDPIVIDWTSTNNFAVTAFKHYDAIYLVTDVDNVKFAPSIRAGAEQALLEPLPAKGGQIYRLILGKDIPSSAKILVEGGNLAWRISVINNQDLDEKRGDQIRNKISLAERNDKKEIDVDLPYLKEQFEFYDARSDENYTVILASDYRCYNPNYFMTPHIEMLESGVGVAFIKRNDTIKIDLESDHLVINAAQDLFFKAGKQTQNSSVVATPDPIKTARINSNDKPALNGKRIFYFDRWLIGLPDNYTEARQQLENNLTQALPKDKPEALLTLAKFLLAHQFAPEASGYLDLASIQVPALETDPEFRALRGATFTLMENPYDALQYLEAKSLDNISEIDMWRAIANALAFEWDKAIELLPDKTPHLYYYTADIRAKLSEVIAEIHLRNQNPEAALEILELMDRDKENLSPHNKAAILYLRGEARRLQGETVGAIELWDEVAQSNDQLYRVKAILARTVLQLKQRAIKPTEAIEELEKLRFAWRGDGIETQIARVLGRLYLTEGQWEEAFELMRNAAGFAQGSQEGREMTAAMTQAFSQLFTNPPTSLNALDAVSLYDRFSELVPAGDEGRSVLRGLTKFLLEIDLLGRAADVYEKLLGMDGSDVEKLNDGLQLAAIRLLSLEPEKALDVLESDQIATTQGNPTQNRSRTLLKARALADMGEYNRALAILDGVTPDKDSLSLAVDTAWGAQNWKRAGNEVARLLATTDLSADVLTDDQVGLILNYAVALKLDEQTDNLARLRSKFLSKLPKGSKHDQLEVITRPSQNSTLADRETLLNIASEVDLFQSFLEVKPEADVQ